MFLINSYIVGGAVSGEAVFTATEFTGEGTLISGPTYKVPGSNYTQVQENGANYYGYYWKPPAGVTNVCIICIGGGGSGGRGTGASGGGGGALIYANNVPVSQQNYFISVGNWGIPASSSTNPTGVVSGGASGFGLMVTKYGYYDWDGTYVSSGQVPDYYLLAGGGSSGITNFTYGGYSGGGGGAAGYAANGGKGGDPGYIYQGSRTGGARSYTSNSSILPYGAVGYSGGISGAGSRGGPTYNGAGYNALPGNNGETASGGAGGGGGSGYWSGGGGGVGMYGQSSVNSVGDTGGAGGAGGAAWLTSGGTYSFGSPGIGSSGGSNGTMARNTGTLPLEAGHGGLYGGGGGGYQMITTYPGGSSTIDQPLGQRGVVRIIWGTGRSFPFNAAAL